MENVLKQQSNVYRYPPTHTNWVIQTTISFYAHSDLFFFNRTRCSNRLSHIDTRRQVFVSPAQLNMRSAAALAGSGVFSCTNSRLRVGQAAMLHVSVDVLVRYCASSSARVADAGGAARCRLLKNAASSSWLPLSSEARIHTGRNNSSREWAKKT